MKKCRNRNNIDTPNIHVHEQLNYTPNIHVHEQLNYTPNIHVHEQLNYTPNIPYSPNGKRNIRDPFKENIDSSRTVAMIQRGPWSWTNSIIFITIADLSRTMSKYIL